MFQQFALTPQPRKPYWVTNYFEVWLKLELEMFVCFLFLQWHRLRPEWTASESLDGFRALKLCEKGRCQSWEIYAKLSGKYSLLSKHFLIILLCLSEQLLLFLTLK